MFNQPLNFYGELTSTLLATEVAMVTILVSTMLFNKYKTYETKRICLAADR